jgi:hypothetical protein
MGGSGSGGYFSGDPNTVRRELSALRTTSSAEFEAETANALVNLLGQMNNRDVEAISRHLDDIKQIFEDELDEAVYLRFGGSVAKHTYVDGLSDVDCLVFLDKCELAEGTPNEARTYLADRLRERLEGADVSEGTLAVTARFDDAEVQILPAVSCEGAVQIADSTGNDWSKIRPREFSRVLTNVNEANGRKVVPTIKLAKAIIANFPDQMRISGYHTESLAVKIFRTYDGPQTLRSMLRAFFERAASEVRAPIKDRTGQSVHVDDYLGREGTLERRILSDYMGRIARRMALADSTQSVEQWTSMFES